MGKKISLEERIKQAKEIHGNRYDYSLITEYKNDRTKYPIICPEHGVFYKSFNKHISCKQGCPKCSGKFRYNTETFKETAQKLKHCKDYTFEKVNYLNNKKSVIVTCHVKDEDGIEHGDFKISPTHLLSGEGCPKCRYIKSAASKRRTIDDIVTLSKEVHGDKYDYSLITEYKNDRTRYPIICSEHGVFLQTMNNHIKGKQGCPKCGRISASNKTRLTTEEFIEKARQIHGDKYDYSKVNYIDSDTNICIICPEHGEFWMEPSNHLMGQNCRKCSLIDSKPEVEVYNFVCQLVGEDNVIQRDRLILKGKELDIYLPFSKIGIELDGLYWHNELVKGTKYHLNKTIACEKQGIHLFHIFEDEWLYKQDIVRSILKNMLNKTENSIMARKCEVREVKAHEANEFLEKNHLQGKCGSSVKLGLYYNNELVSLMTFGKSRHFVGNGKHQWELLRFCNKLNTNITGGASKLFKYFIKKHEPDEIITYADRRWSNGNLYNILGFTKYNESKPNYYYVINNRRHYRFNFRKSILVNKYGCPENMSEHDFCLSQKWYRIYDCGCFCYIWKKEK